MMVESTLCRRADHPADDNVVELTPTASAPRRRGRPRKPTEKTPADKSTFDAVANAIKGIPPDERAKQGKAAKPGRNAAKDEARAAVARDTRLARTAVILFNRVLDEIRWKEGRCCYSNADFAQLLGIDRSSVTRGFQALTNAGHLLRRRRKTSSGNFFAETTIPALIRASQRVGAGKSEVGAGKAEVGANSHFARCRDEPIPSEERPELALIAPSSHCSDFVRKQRYFGRTQSTPKSAGFDPKLPSPTD
jgi:hypothetical protein